MEFFQRFDVFKLTNKFEDNNKLDDNSKIFMLEGLNKCKKDFCFWFFC